eukprot:gene17270-23587_t
MALQIVTCIPWNVLAACVALFTALYFVSSLILDIQTKVHKRIDTIREECISLVNSKLRQDVARFSPNCNDNLTGSSNNTGQVVVLNKTDGKAAGVEDESESESDSDEEYTDDQEGGEDEGYDDEAIMVDNMIDIVGTIITSSNLSPSIDKDEDHEATSTTQTYCVITDIDADATKSIGSDTSLPQQTEIVPIDDDSISSASLQPLSTKLNEGKLKSMRVDELRRLLSTRETPGVTATAITSMRKDAIVSLLMNTSS